MSDSLVSEPESYKPNNENRAWILLAVIAVVGISTAMLVPAISEQKLNPLSLLYSVLLATIAFGGIWRHRKKSILWGAGIGAVLGVSMFAVAALASILAARVAGT